LTSCAHAFLPEINKPLGVKNIFNRERHEPHELNFSFQFSAFEKCHR